MLIPGIEKTLNKIPSLCKNSRTNNKLSASIDCSNIIGSLAVYRLSFGMTIFFFILSLLVSLLIIIKTKIINSFIFR